MRGKDACERSQGEQDISGLGLCTRGKVPLHSMTALAVTDVDDERNRQVRFGSSRRLYGYSMPADRKTGH
eukprot:11930-Heterococcus_DN1.PRE.2